MSTPILTPRQRECFKLCAECFVSKEIAEKLGITKPMVDAILRRTMRALGIKNRMELIHYALANDLTKNKFTT